MKHEGYRLNLLQNAKFQMKQSGGSCGLRNGDHVVFYAADGRTCIVWYPPEGRVRDLDIADLKEAIEEMSGHKPFTLSASVS